RRLPPTPKPPTCTVRRGHLSAVLPRHLESPHPPLHSASSLSSAAAHASLPTHWQTPPPPLQSASSLSSEAANASLEGTRAPDDPDTPLQRTEGIAQRSPPLRPRHAVRGGWG